MKAKCFFILLLSLLFAGCVPSTSTPTFDVDFAVQQTLSAMSTENEESTSQSVESDLPTQFPSDTPILIPTETSTYTPTEILPNISGCIPIASDQEIGLVANVVDGETIEVLNNQLFIVKYLGIASPELSDPGQMGNAFSSSATEKNRELVEGQIIT